MRFSSFGDKLRCEACSNGERESFSVGWKIGRDEVRERKNLFSAEISEQNGSSPRD